MESWPHNLTYQTVLLLRLLLLLLLLLPLLACNCVHSAAVMPLC